ncbi:MAG: hypothetical protein ACLP01_04335 [Solirubrobacteraceae bacterium]
MFVLPVSWGEPPGSLARTGLQNIAKLLPPQSSPAHMPDLLA